MKISAELNYLRMAPRKVRLAADLLRGKRVPEAEYGLRFVARQARQPLVKLLRSAVANAKHDFRVTNEESLVISEITVNRGPALKRRRARAFGRAFPITKHSSHIKLVLETKEGVLPKKGLKKAAVDIVRPEDTKVKEQVVVPREERKFWKAKPKVATKTTEFVRRIFRRKAI